MRILEKIGELILFPINWFWNQLETYREKNSIGKIILLFVCSFSGLLLIVGSLVWLMYYLINYHIEIIVIVGLIIWLYAYVKSKNEKKVQLNTEVSNQQQQLLVAENEQLVVNAEKGYTVMRNIIYQSLKEVADSIGGKVPRTINEIEAFESRYIITDNICFYQYKLYKDDIHIQYTFEDLVQFIEILRACVSRKIQSGHFPTFGTSTYLDADGCIWDGVIIDIIEDMGTYITIQAVFYSPEYVNMIKQIKLNQQIVNNSTAIPDATWSNRL